MHPSDTPSGGPVTSTLTRKIFSKTRRQIWQRVNNPGTVPTTEHLMLGDWSPSLSTRTFKDYTDHRALGARGLVAQSIDSDLQRLYRPPSTWCSGTGRPVYRLGTSNTVPTTEHLILGDWSSSLSARKLQNIAPTNKRLMLGDWSSSIATQDSKECTWYLGPGGHTIVHQGTGRSVCSIADGLVKFIF